MMNEGTFNFCASLSKAVGRKTENSTDRKRADVVFRRQTFNQQATDDAAAADQLEASLSGDDKTILRMAKPRKTQNHEFSNL